MTLAQAWYMFLCVSTHGDTVDAKITPVLGGYMVVKHHEDGSITEWRK